MKFHVVLLVTLALASSAVRAEVIPNLSAFNTNFCADPVGAICGDLTTNLTSREWRLSPKRADITERALERTRTVFNLSKFAVPNLDALVNLQVPQDQKQRILHYFVMTVRIIATPMIGEAERTRLWDYLAEVKSLLLAAIDEVYPPSGMTRVRNLQLKNEIERVEVLDSLRIFLLKRRNPAHGEIVEKETMGACGIDGLEDQAFALKLTDGTKYLVVCPGFLLGGYVDSNLSPAILQNLIQVLGHEWGHHIDNDDVPEIYGAFANCMKKTHVHRLSPRIRLPGEPPLDPTVNWNDPDLRVRLHLGEMIGDFWGAQTVVQYLRRHPEFTYMQRLNALRVSYGGHCHQRTEGIHPRGYFRIDTQLAETPAIRDLMGCGSPILRRAACTLDGLYDPLGFGPIRR